MQVLWLQRVLPVGYSRAVESTDRAVWDDRLGRPDLWSGRHPPWPVLLQLHNFCRHRVWLRVISAVVGPLVNWCAAPLSTWGVFGVVRELGGRGCVGWKENKNGPVIDPRFRIEMAFF